MRSAVDRAPTHPTSTAGRGLSLIPRSLPAARLLASYDDSDFQDLRALLAYITGFWVDRARRPAPLGLPTLRTWQARCAAASSAVACQQTGMDVTGPRREHTRRGPVHHEPRS